MISVKKTMIFLLTNTWFIILHLEADLLNTKLIVLQNGKFESINRKEDMVDNEVTHETIENIVIESINTTHHNKKGSM